MASAAEIAKIINGAASDALAVYSQLANRPVIVTSATPPQLINALAQQRGSEQNPTAGLLLSSPTTTLIILVAGVALVVWALRKK